MANLGVYALIGVLGVYPAAPGHGHIEGWARTLASILLGLDAVRLIGLRRRVIVFVPSSYVPSA